MTKIFIEFDELDKIFKEIKGRVKDQYLQDTEIKNLIDNIFWEIDAQLMRYEADYKFKKCMYGDNKSDSK